MHLKMPRLIFMRCFLKRYISFLLFLQVVTLFIDSDLIFAQPEQESPEVILNDKKVIFNKKPILDHEGWLFPLEEIASRLQEKVTTDLINGVITVNRTRDNSVVELNIRNGIVTINNRPFRTLFGYNRIILSSDSQMVPTSALVILLGLTSRDDTEGKLILKNTITTEAGISGTIQPAKRTGLRDLLIDYLTVTNTYDWLKTTGLASRRTEINNGFHNDNYALTTNLILKAGTDTPLINFDSANVSYYKNGSPLQVHVGDKPLYLVKSPLLGGITIRGVEIQTKGWMKDSKFVFSSGLLPSDGKVVGKGLSLVKYGRLTEIAEWASSPKKDWQFSIGEALYNDLITNQLIRTKQSGGLFALSATKTGRFFEIDSNLAFGNTKNKISTKVTSGPAVDVLLRLKPNKWINLFTKGAYYSPGFYSLSGNPYYHDRNEGTVGINLSFKKINLGASHSIGMSNLNTDKPNVYKVTNIFGSVTPLKNGPTVVTSYSKNDSKISETRAIDNLLFPINSSTLSIYDLDTLIERRTSSFFRTSLLKSWHTVNLSSSINYFTFAQDSPLRVPIFGERSVSKLFTYDLNINKYVNRLLSLQSYFQGSDLYRQVKFGVRLGPILNNKLILLLQSGGLLQANKEISPIYNLNLNYQIDKKNLFSLNFDKTSFLTNLSLLWQYNLRGKSPGATFGSIEDQSVGTIKGKVVLLDDTSKKEHDQNKIVLPVLTRERGIANIRIHLGSYTILTNANGSFEFPSLVEGVHRLKIEYSDIPSYLTAITPEAVDVKVEAGKETRFNFVLAYFGEVSGHLQLANGQKLELEELPELQDIRVYLEGTEFETLTNKEGAFVLGDVKPGRYKVKIDPDFLPDSLDIENKGIDVEVRAKRKLENINLPIKCKDKIQEIKEF